VSGLGVISRTSAENYDQKGKTMKQIGADLGVDYVLEGSVRWDKAASGKGRVRITPQLVRVTDDTPVWSETYDREVKDIFDVQTDIATHVVDALGVTLQGSERQDIAEKPTDNVDAYQLYVKAKNIQCSTGNCDSEMVALLEQAVALDPKFLAAWYELSHEHSLMYHMNFDRTEKRIGRAKEALDRMESLDPNDPLTRLARGFYYYYAFRDYTRALTEFTAVADALPNSADAHFAIGLIHRRRGELDESISSMLEAIRLDPKNAQYMWDVADSYDGSRQPDLALQYYNRSLAIKDEPSVLADKANTTLRFRGDVAAAQQIVAVAPARPNMFLAMAQAQAFLWKRDYTRALASLHVADSQPFQIRAYIDGLIGQAEFARDRKPGPRPSLQKAAQELETVLKDAPSSYPHVQMLALVYADLGRSEDAIREAKLAVELTAKDEYAAPQTLETLAQVYAVTGHADESLELIERLLTMNYDDPLTLTTLRMDPKWDSLRDNSKFKAILKRSA
jgi:tetratricopeptide (TPR) repeat protein